MPKSTQRSDRKQSSSHEKKRIEVNALFDAVSHELGIREWEIFQRVYPTEKEALEKLWHFLDHVGECPPEIILYCRELLAGRRRP